MYIYGLLNNYRKTMVDKISKEEKLKFKRFACLVQKISLYLLKGVIENRKIETLFIEIDDIFISRGKIDGDVLKLIDNPIFRKYVVLCVNYNTFINQRKAFCEDYNFGCFQDFSHINDVYTKTENIYKEGIFNYLLVSNCKDKDRDYFQKYENEGMKVLVFEEE